jgi:hypothetical protein
VSDGERAILNKTPIMFQPLSTQETSNCVSMDRLCSRCYEWNRCYGSAKVTLLGRPRPRRGAVTTATSAGGVVCLRAVAGIEHCFQ